MKNAYLSPYLNFNGTCAQAMTFYQKVLGGKLEMQKFGDTPMEMPAEHKNRIMHATLQNDTLSFMASDSMPGNEIVFGNNVHISIAGTDEALLKKIFDGLAEGGKVDMPLAKQFWGDTFGMLTDKFGIHWMINIGMGGQPK